MKNIKKTNILTKHQFNNIEIIVIAFLTLVAGIFIGSVINKLNGTNSKFASYNNTSELTNAYKDIVNNYYGQVDEEKLIEAGIQGMLSYLNDPYASYTSIEDTETNEELEGSYIGLGAEVTRSEEGIFTVTKVYENKPADKCGIQEGDIILEVHDTKVEGISASELSSLIKGEVGSKEKIKLLRKDEEIIIEFKREKIEITSVTNKVFEKNNKTIGYIKITAFAKNTESQFINAYEDLKKENIDSLILDLRDNKGGYLSSLQKILSKFLNKNDIMYYTGIQEPTKAIKNSQKKAITEDVTILINATTASASEILASSLKDNLNSTIIGEKSYGKGVTQKITTLNSGATIKYTTEKWWTPSKQSIDKKGITPDLVIEMDKEYYSELSQEKDNQLQKAIEISSKN